MIDQVALENIRRDQPDLGFEPKQLDREDVNRVRETLARELGCDDLAGPIIDTVAQHGELLTSVDLTRPDTTIEDALDAAGVTLNGDIYLMWAGLPGVDVIPASDLGRVFDYIYNPPADDLLIMDGQGDWCLAIRHHGDATLYNRSNPARSAESDPDDNALPRLSSAERLREVAHHEIELHPTVEVVRGVEYVNVSGFPLNQLLAWLPPNLNAERVVFLPDVCPGRSPLPTGCVVKTFDPNWRELAVSDVGCGMQVLRSNLDWNDFERNKGLWDAVGRDLQRNAGKLGDLGGGNHFIDAIVDFTDDRVYFLIHTGSRLESGTVDHLVHLPREFDHAYEKVVEWARSNRDTVGDVLARHYGALELTMDTPHNTVEKCADGGVILRKGAVKVNPGELAIIPSSMTGDIALVEATRGVETTLNSLSHGTGRTMPRSRARNSDVVSPADIATLRNSVYIPDYIADSSLRTDAPICYRKLDDCLGLLGSTVRQTQRFGVLAYLGHL